MGTIWLQGERKRCKFGGQEDCYHLDCTDPITKIWTEPPTVSYTLYSRGHGEGEVVFDGVGTTYPPGVKASSIRITSSV